MRYKALHKIQGLIVFTTVLLLCVKTNYGQSPARLLFFDEYIEPRFNGLLVEGKVQMLAGNYDSALNYYSEALKIKPQSGAVNYELSRIFYRLNDLDIAGIYGRRAYLSDEANKWYILNLAEIYQGQQKNDSAIYLMDKLIEIEPENPEYKYVMAQLLENKGLFERALSYLNDVEDQLGVIREIVLEKYKIHLRLNQGEEALEVLKNASEFLTDDYAINGIIAEYYNTTGNTDSAWYYYRRIVKENVGIPDVAVSYGNFLMENNMPDSAVSVFGGLIRSENTPKELVADVLRQFVSNDKEGKLLSVSEKLAEMAYQRFSDDLTIISLYADIQNSSGNYINLEKALKGIIKQDPKNYLAWEQLLYIESSLGRNDSIIKYGERAVLFFNDRPVPFYFLGAGYYMKKDYSNALRILKDGFAKAEVPELKFQFYSLMADCYYHTGFYENTWENFEKALEIDPVNALVNNNYAYYLAERNEDLNKALEMIEVSLKNGGEGEITYIDTYAWVLYKMGDYKKAEKILKSAVKTDNGKDPEIFEHFGDILFSMNKKSKALKYWRGAIELGSENSRGIEEKIKKVSEN